MEDIETQVQVLLDQGYRLHGAVVAQPNPQYYNNSAGLQQPYLYYQMLARQKQAAASTDFQPEERKGDL